jgi:hypothetical protein
MSESHRCGPLMPLVISAFHFFARGEGHCAREITEEAGASIAPPVTHAEAAQTLGHQGNAYALFQRACWTASRRTLSFIVPGSRLLCAHLETIRCVSP